MTEAQVWEAFQAGRTVRDFDGETGKLTGERDSDGETIIFRIVAENFSRWSDILDLEVC
jgi:hypothetical protein